MPRSGRATRILIADDNAIFRKALRQILDQADDIHVVGETSNGRDTVTIAVAEKVDLVLMDLEMPIVDGLAATRALAAPDAPRRIPVLALSSHLEERYVVGALESGAAGYLVKTRDMDRLVDAIRAIVHGDGAMSDFVTAAVVRALVRRRQAWADDPKPDVLSTAERRVATRLAQGLTSLDDIAMSLGVAKTTVRSQLQAALRKTGFADRTQLALWAARQGLDVIGA